MKQKTGDFTTHPKIIALSGAAIVIGIICAFIAIVLLKLIYFFTNLFFYQRFSLAYITPTHNHLHAWVIVPPVIGAILIGFIARYGSEKIRGHGIPEAIEAMLVNKSQISARTAFWKPISAAISIGSGGPFGAEGPIIMTGGSFGSLFSQFFHLSSIDRRILLVAGAAGGMSATFAAPVSSVLFAVELLMFEFKPRSLVPIALASAAADAIRTIFLGNGPLFAMAPLAHVGWQLMTAAIAIGISGSVFAIILTRAIYGVEDLFGQLPIHWMWWPAMGAIIIGLGGWISPRALGVGYGSISAMLNVKLTIATLLALLITKIVIWVIGLGSGTSGGILAPILIIGGSFGGEMGLLLHVPHPGVWALLGMSAIFSGVTRTPLTSIVFPLELTHNLNALLPLLVTSSIATGLSALVLPRSILTEKIARRGLHLTREYQTDPLQMHYCKHVAWIPTVSISHDRIVGDIGKEYSHYPGHTWIAVVNADGTPRGIILAWEIVRQSMQSPESPVYSLLENAPIIKSVDSVKAALNVMLRTNHQWVRVVNVDNTLQGFLTIHQMWEIRNKEYQDETVKSAVFILKGKSAIEGTDG